MTIEVERAGPKIAENSNPTSQATDASSITNSSDPSDVSAQLRFGKDKDRSDEAHRKWSGWDGGTSATRGFPSPRAVDGLPPVENRKPRTGPFRAMVQFEPAVECLCHAYRVKFPLTTDEHAHDRDNRGTRFNWKWPRKGYTRRKDKLYEVKLKRDHYRHYSKPFAEDGSTEGIPKKKYPEYGRSDDDLRKHGGRKNEELEEISERIDIYYFDHGNSAYYRTTDSPPILASEACAEKTDLAATRFWAEIFGTIHIGIAFVTAFVLQLLRFLLHSIIRPLTVGVLQLLADYFVKPFFSIFFNAIVQPVLILLYNVATSVRDLCEPLAEAIGFFLREFAVIVRAFRIVENTTIYNDPSPNVAT